MIDERDAARREEEEPDDPRSLRALSDTDHVENVFLFIADSVRSDVTSENITSLGVSGTAISPSTLTASSVPSIVTGDYPTTHRIWDFNDELPERSLLLKGPETFRMHADTVWKSMKPVKKPPLKITGVREDEVGHLSDIPQEDPFIIIEHHKGGHTPYGGSDSEYESTPEFFESRRPTLEELPSLYAESVREAEDVFLDRVEYLDRHGLLEDTLIIYTSDHGEHLGEPENGMNVGHGTPITPDVVNVPLVFAGAGLPNKSVNWSLSGVDIAPTALSALARDTTSQFDGCDCWSSVPEVDRFRRSEIWSRLESDVFGNIFGGYDVYRATSVWDRKGGYVFHHNNRGVRTGRILLSHFIGANHAYLNRSPRNIRRWIGFIKTVFPNTVKYGAPRFSQKAGMNEIKPFKQARENREEIDKEQLKKLGYLK